MLQNYQPQLVVIEACGIAAWVHDLCRELGFEILVCNPNQEAWRWKNVKRKTDRDDALKLAKLAALGQLVPVHIPELDTREHRWLVKYRKTILGRLNRVRNILRALYAQHGLSWCEIAKARNASSTHEAYLDLVERYCAAYRFLLDQGSFARIGRRHPGRH